MRQQNNRGHFALRLLFVLVFLIILLVCLAPMIISTGWGKSMLIQAVHKWSPYRLQAQTVNISWLNGQSFEGVEVHNSKDEAVFRCQSLSTDAPLWQIAFQHEVGTLKIVSPKVTLEANIGPAPSVAFAQAGLIPNLDFRPSFDFTGNITVENGEVDLISPGFDKAEFRNLSIDAQIPKTGPMHLYAQGVSKQGTIDGNFNISASVDKMINAKLSLVQFPVRGTAAAITGPAVNLDVNIAAEEDSMQGTIDATSPQFSAHFKVGMSGESVTLTTPGIVDFKVTSALIPGLKKEATAHIDIPSFQMPLSQKEQFSFKAKATFSQLDLAQYTFQPMSLDVSTDNFANKKFLLHVDSPQFQVPDMEFYWQEPFKLVGKDFVLTFNLQKTIRFNLSSQLQPQGQLVAQGTIDPDTLTSNMNITAKQFPTALLDQFAKAPVSGLLGATLDMTAVAQIENGNGTVNLKLQSPTTRTAISGTVQKGILTLNEPVYAQINPNLPQLHPQNPFSVEIPAEGVSIALFPFSLNQINIPNMRIELGKVRAESEGNLAIAAGLLKLTNGSKGSDLNFWFAPIDLHIRSGLIECERTEVLLENAYQLCFWGDVSLPKNKVDMILGLTSGCLKRAFGLKNLPEKYVLQIPVRGTLGDIKVDSSKASSKIAALLLWQQKSLAGSAIGGPGGAILGGLLDKLGPLPDEESNAPPPKKPFPWERESSQTEKPEKKKKHFHKEDKPLDQLLQMIK